MSEALFLINPRRRRKKSRKGKMPAGLRRYWASKRRGRKTTSRKRRRRSHAVAVAPRRRRHKRRAVMANPRRRRAHRRHYAVSRRRHRRSNPFSIKGVTHQLMPAAIGAGGAIALDVAYAYASPYLPASMQTGFIPVLVKLAGAIGIGMAARKFLGREKGNAITLGGLTVVGYGAIKPLVASFAPTIKGLSGYADFVDYGVSPGGRVGQMGAYLPNAGMGAFYSPAPVLSPSANSLGAYIGQPMGDWNWQADGM